MLKPKYPKITYRYVVMDTRGIPYLDVYECLTEDKLIEWLKQYWGDLHTLQVTKTTITLNEHGQSWKNEDIPAWEYPGLQEAMQEANDEG